MLESPSVLSTRISAFERQIQKGVAEATAALAAELKAAKGPLLEPLDQGGVLVTFVYIGDGEKVALSTQLAQSETDSILEGVPMARVPGTKVWHRSIVTAASDLCVCYSYLIDQPSLGGDYEAAGGREDEATHNQILANLFKYSIPDEFNPDRIDLFVDYHFPEEERPQSYWRSVLTLPGAKPLAWIRPAPAADDCLDHHDLSSSVVGAIRRVTVYAPATWRSSGGPVVYLTDGEQHLSGRMHHVLHNLVCSGEIEPTVGVFVHNRDRGSRSIDLSCNPALPEFLASDVIPFMQQRYGVGADPARAVAAGSSLGGLSSLWLGYTRPHIFGNVLAMSGSFWWGQSDLYFDDPRRAKPLQDAQPEWLTRTLAVSQPLPLKVWLDAGTLEVGRPSRHLLNATRRLYAVLLEKGYEVRYCERAGGHDWAGWRRTFGAGLKFLLGRAQ